MIKVLIKHFFFYILDLENISTLYKLLIICAVALYFEEHNANKCTCDICDTSADRLCCQFFKFVFLIILLPLIMVVYISAIVLTIVFGMFTCGTFLRWVYKNYIHFDDYLLNWPCMLFSFLQR